MYAIIQKRAACLLLTLAILLSTFSVLSVPAQADTSIAKDDGKVVYEMGHGQGRFIFYDLDESSGVISDFGLNATEGEKVLLRSLEIEGFVPEDIKILGSLVKMSGENGSAVLHDNPTGLIHVRMNNAAEMTIALAGEMVVIEEKELDDGSDLPHQLVISDGRSEGMIASDREFEVSENGDMVRCESKILMVKFLPQLTVHQNWRQRVIMDAIQDGKVAAEIALNIDGEETVNDVLSYREKLNVQVDEVKRNRFQVSVGGENPQGAVLLIQTDKATMDMVQERLRVMIDDQKARQVEEPMELLFSEPEDISYGYFTEGDIHQMVVYIPANVLGTLTVEVSEPLSEFLTVQGLAMVIGAIALVVLAAVAVFRRF